MPSPSKTVTLEVRALTDAANAKLLGIRKNTEALAKANPEIRVKLEAAGARAEMAVLRKEITSIPKEVTIRVKVAGALDKLSKAGAFAPSGLGIAGALSPALIPLAAGIAAGIGAIGISLASAGVAAGAFALLAKSAFTQASTAAQAVEAAQNRYNAAIATGTKHATAYAAEQRAIRLAYAQMSPQQIQLSKQVGNLQQAWQNVQIALTPLISGALVPWLRVVTGAMQLIKPLVAPIAHLFADWGQALARYFSNPIVMIQLKNIVSAFGNFAAIQFAQIAKFIGDVGKAFFNLGKDLQGAGAHLGDAGTALAGIGAAFLTWSKSEQARDDVQGFLSYLHKEGPVVRGILKDLGTLLPGIFKGATAAGTLELKAIAGFLGFIAGLPKGWQAPLTEAAGALLLLSKTGVVSVGLKLTGKLAEHPTAFGFTIGTLLAAGIVEAVNRHAPGKESIWQRFSPPPKGQQQTWLNSWSGLGDAIVTIADKTRHQLAHIWDLLWNNTVGRAERGRHDIAVEFDTWRHDTATVFDKVRHDIAHIWDLVWQDTIGRVKRGISDVINWFKSLPGRVVAALRGLGTTLWNLGHTWLTDMWHGIESVVSDVMNFFTSLPGKILQWLGIHSPPGWAIDAGKQIMHGLGIGMKQAHSRVAQATRAVAEAAQDIANQGTAGGGPVSADAAAAMRYAQSQFPRYGWSMGLWPSLRDLWMGESGWNRLARNPSSGAYGIPQALPASKMGAAANPPTSSAGAQINWGLSYISSVYGNPGAAYNTWLSRSPHWYGAGFHGWFDRPTLIGVGERGRERVDIGGGEQRVVLEIRAGPSDYEQFLLQQLRRAVRVRGGNVQTVLGR